jgi:predicted metal-binding protein
VTAASPIEHDTPSPAAQMTIFVCASCGDKVADPSGTKLIDALAARLPPPEMRLIAIESADCLAVCKRPGTIAFAAAGKWTYVIGDVDAELHADDIIAAAASFAQSANGIVPWRERPQIFRKGVVARIPPIGHKTEAKK